MQNFPPSIFPTLFFLFRETAPPPTIPKLSVTTQTESGPPPVPDKSSGPSPNVIR